MIDTAVTHLLAQKASYRDVGRSYESIRSAGTIGGLVGRVSRSMPVINSEFLRLEICGVGV